MERTLLKISLLCFFVCLQSRSAFGQQRVENVQKGDQPAASIAKQVESLARIGYDNFKIDVSKISPGPIDKSYVLSPNDKLVLKVWGQLQFNYTISVSSDMYLEVPDIPGRIYVTGLSLAEVEDRVRRQMATVYAANFDLKQPAASTAFVDLSLAEVHDIRFLVQGEVVAPGSYSLHPSLANIIYALASAGGVKDVGSLRNIKIRRGQQVINFDFYDFLLRGNVTAIQAQIRNNDIIFVPLKRKEVTIKGEVKRPGIYEILDPGGEDLETLIELTGGFRPTANLKKVLILRTELTGGLKTLDIDLTSLRRSGQRITLQDQDIVNVYPSPPRRLDYVSLRGGGIATAGEYELKPGMRLRDLIQRAGGLLREANLGRADLVRTEPDMTKTYRQVDLQKVMSSDDSQNLLLQPLDELTVYTTQDIEGEQKYVVLRGHVKQPGRLPFYRNLRLYDLLFVRGGFQDQDYVRGTYLERADLIRAVAEGTRRELIKFDLGKLLEGDQSQNIELQSDDEVVIYSKEEILGGDRFVTLTGHAKNPGQHKLYEGMRLLDLLNTVGGYQDPDFRRLGFLQRGDLIRPVNRTGNRVDRELIEFNVAAVLDGDPKENLELRSGDEVKLYKAAEFQEQHWVTIEGLVTKPGRYELLSNMTLNDLLVQAGGLTEAAYQTRAEIARLNLQSNPEVEQEMFTANISDDYFRPAAGGSFLLRNNDIVFIRRRPGVVTAQIVEIQGEVNFPGKYPLTLEKKRVSDLIALAGGLRTESAFLLGASLNRQGVGRVVVDFDRALKEPQSPENLVLLDGDSIVIPKILNVVKVEGEVFYPAVLPFREGMGVDYYIKKAGGTKSSADTSKTVILHPNGRATLSKGFLYFGKTKVLPGSTITVPSKFAKPREVMSSGAAPKPEAVVPPAPATPPGPPVTPPPAVAPQKPPS